MLTRCATRVARTVQRFHNDEAGNESLQTIMIMAIGAVVMVGLHKIWKTVIKPGTETNLAQMLGLDFTN